MISEEEYRRHCDELARNVPDLAATEFDVWDPNKSESDYRFARDLCVRALCACYEYESRSGKQVDAALALQTIEKLMALPLYMHPEDTNADQ